MSESLPSWSFFVDTGGTFTDCLALDPHGTIHRAKVLSRGSLSARIASIESGNCLGLDGSPDWPDGFPVGFRLIGEDGECQVSGWNKAGSKLQFEGQLPKSLQIGDAIELLSGEEAPVLGQRLILARAGFSPISASKKDPKRSKKIQKDPNPKLPQIVYYSTTISFHLNPFDTFSTFSQLNTKWS